MSKTIYLEPILANDLEAPVVFILSWMLVLTLTGLMLMALATMLEDMLIIKEQRSDM